MKLMKRRDFLRAAGLGAAACVAGSGATARPKTAKRPNIVWIYSDDHAQNAVSAYGGRLAKVAPTPNIDRIAREGVRFDNYCCNNSICSPARGSVLTGQYSHKNGVTGLEGAIREGSPWVSTELRKAGYQTGVFGKWHLASKPRGFDDFKITSGQGAWFDPTFYTPQSDYQPRAKKLTKPQKYEGYSSDVYTDVALEWLKKRDAAKPFCLMLHFKAPHHSYEYPKRHEKMLEGVKVPEPASLHEDVAAASLSLLARVRGV